MEKVNKTEKFWDRLANRFDKRAGHFERTYNQTVENTQKHLHAGDIVLDYGCATGEVAIEIAGDVKEVHGIDISSKMIAAAKSKAAERKIKNVDFTYTTIFVEGFKKESFDVILALNILHLVEDTQKVIQRINELLKPGGLIVSATACMGEKKSFINILIFLLTKMRIIPCMKFFEISELKDSITNGNFQIVEAESLNQSGTEYFIAAKKI